MKRNRHDYKGPGITIKPNRMSVPVALGLMIAIAGYLVLGSTAKAAEAKMQGSKVFLINQSVGTKTDALISLARDAKTQVYECNKLKLSKKATLMRDNADD